MNIKKFSKKSILEFSPELHWDIILFILAVCVISVSVYFSYMYVTLNHRIEDISKNITIEVTSTKEDVSFQKIINIETVIGTYREREKSYAAAIDALVKKVPVVVIPPANTASSTATSTVASSSVR